ncbi:MAG: DegT/DnrJ/EryC1/StrS family aminotransferase [Phycisphaerales bacterium]|nr:MAG: DegT/DnrJ/EryC1/StrS family aminotransferase [Phycisphaerales bacterium]
MSDNEIPLSKPDLGPLEEQKVMEVLRSGRLSIGPMQERFEQMVSARAGCREGVAVSSGTCGLHLVLLALGIGPGDEVITTPFSFVASANVILHVGATPVFVDIDPKSLNADPAQIEASITPRTRAILAVEAFGNPTHMDAYAQLAAKHEIPLIEDCCEALGTTYKGRPCGSFGRAGVFGFYPNKQITTGEGGMIVTDDERLAARCRSLRNQGRGAMSAGGQGSWLKHERLGYNYRMSELQAALGVAQMERLDELITARQRVANMYVTRLAANGDVILPTVSPESSMSWFVFVVRLAAEYSREERDRVIQGMRNHEVGSADYFPCIHEQSYFIEWFEQAGRTRPSFPIAETVAGRTIALPFYTTLTEREVDLVCQTLEVMIQRENLRRS